jgi:signal peptidase II
MAKLLSLRDSWRGYAFAAIALFIVVADQLTKWWIRANLAPGESLFDAGFFQIVHVRNTGAAFGIFRGHPLVFTVVDFIGIFVFLFLVLFLRRRWPLLGRMWVLAGIALLLGGTVGNLIDRLRLGDVTDFLDFKLWPVFNVADSAVTVGVIILVSCILFLPKSSGSRL